MNNFVSGFIAIVGRPNAGKSTLLNSLIQQKISIVSPKPQTTRDAVLGIWTDENCQMVFVDTPGSIKPKNALGDYMAKTIERAVIDVDCILLVIDGHDGISEEEIELVKKYGAKNIPLVVAITKTDIAQPEKLMPELSKLNEFSAIKEVYSVSAKRNRNIDELKNGLKKYLKSSEMFFPEEDITDKSERYIVCELIREKILLCCEKEIPHGVGIVLNKMEYDENALIWDIDANIIVEKQSHKPIILGKQGKNIKEIGLRARQSIEKMLDARVYLALWVKVKEDWRDNPYMLNEIGYKDK
ncbi:MAG TPA: GTPase Era [Eubacteriales bacterium]|nr:GTPase Era [Eubacteriales bacterium]